MAGGLPLIYSGQEAIVLPSGNPIAIHIGGNGVTGSVYVDNADYRNWLRQVYSAEVAEMESAAGTGTRFLLSMLDQLTAKTH